MNKKKPRFYIGISEIGDYTLRLSQGIREQGFSVTNVVRKFISPLNKREALHDRYIPQGRNKYFNQLMIVGEFLRSIFFYDIFVFCYSTSFTSTFLMSPIKIFRKFACIDLAIMKFLGKKVVFVANGDDLRSRRKLIVKLKESGLLAHAAYAEKNLVLDEGGTDKYKQMLINKFERYVDYIFARPNYTQLLKRSYHLLWLPVDVEAFIQKIDKPAAPIVVHAPSDSKIKGTEYVLEAVGRLEKEAYDFKFILLENMDNALVRDNLAKAHIAIDQLILPGYGLFAVEAMASGCTVLGSAIPGYNGFGEDLPIMTTTPDTIYQNLKELLTNPQLRNILAEKGVNYVRQYHDYQKVSKDFLDIVMSN